MALSNPSLTWDSLDSVYYRSRICYDSIDWPLDLPIDNYNISIGPFASLIAFYPKDDSLINNNNNDNNLIKIITGSGIFQYEINWNFSNKNLEIVKIGWLLNGTLVILLNNFKYRLYYNFNGDFEEFDLLPFINYDLSSISIISCIFYKIGFAFQTSNNLFIYVSKPPNPSSDSIVISNQLFTNDSVDPYHIKNWLLIPPPDNSLNSLKKIYFIIFTSNGLCKLNAINNLNFISNDYLNNSNIINFLDLSSNNNFISILSNNNNLLIFDINFNNLLLNYKIDSNSEIFNMKWCSNDVVVISFINQLLVIGPNSNTLSYFTSSKPYLLSEFDGLYYLTNNNLNFLSKIDEISIKTLKLNSNYPSAILFNSIELLDKHSPKVNYNLEIIKNDLVLAVDGCTRTANNEFDIYWQKILIRAASFGKIHLQLYDSNEYIQSCNYLRILNNVRSNEIGIFLTYNQLLFYGIDNLIDLLLLKNLHYLSIKISKFLNLPIFKILNSWAISKIKNSNNLNDDKLLKILIENLKNENVDWTLISENAYNEGRILLSKKLLTYEFDTSKKIQFLLNINSNNDSNELDFALCKADEDFDVDSIILVLLELLNYNSINNIEICRLINDKFATIGLLKSCIYQINSELLENFLFQDDNLFDMILINLKKKLYDNDDNNSNNNNINELHLKKIISLSNKSKNLSYLSNDFNNLKNLYKLQNSLIDKFPSIIIGEPIIQTLKKIILIDLKKAKAIYKKFNISNIQFSNLVLNILSQNNEHYQELYDFSLSNEGGKLIGFEEFFYKFLKLKEFRQAGIYLSLCKKLPVRQKIKYFVICGMWREAINEASLSKDLEILQNMADSTTGWESKTANDELSKLKN